jgi:lipopolysaccharide export system protein LptA
MIYTGNVQLWRGNAYIKAGRLNASGQSGQTSKVHAEAPAGGKEQVQSTLQNIRATSDTVDYDDSKGVIHYLGHVRAQKQDMILETPDMTVNFRDNTVTDIVASGGVIVTRVDQRGTGDRAVYVAATDVVTLTGKNAQVHDKEQGLVQGPALTMTNKGKTIHVESNQGERTITKHPVKSAKPSAK